MDSSTWKGHMNRYRNASKFLIRFIDQSMENAVDKIKDRVRENIEEFLSPEVKDNLVVLRDVSLELYEKHVLANIDELSVQVSRIVQVATPVVTEICVFMLSIGGPWIYLLLCYASNSLVKFSKYVSRRLGKQEQAATNRSLAILANMWTRLTELYHGHTVIGMENIPSNSAAILVWYHGPIPVDYFGLVARLYLRDGRLVNSVVDRFLTTLPQWSDVEHNFKVTSAGKGYCVELLEHGELLGVAVGGAREAFLDFDYAADWGNRQGFAKVALLTGVPIIPIFTENIREAYCTMKTGRNIWRYLYEKTKLPLVPVYGGFPVRLTTFVGQPIRVQRDETAEQLSARVQEAMQRMIGLHQSTDTGLGQLLMERFTGQDMVTEEEKMV